MNIIGNLIKTVINRIFKNSHNESTNKKKLTTGKEHNFSEKLKLEYPTENPIFQYDIEALNRVLERNTKNTQYGIEDKLLYILSKKMALGIKFGPLLVNKITESSSEDFSKRVALDFFKSIDEEFYEHAKTIIEGKSPIEFKMYKLDEINDFDSLNEEGFPMYTKIANIYSNDKKTILYIPCKGTIEDIYFLVHEIAHTFDLNQENELNNTTRHWLAEITPAFFEARLTKYLYETKSASEDSIYSRESAGILSKYDDTIETYAKLYFIHIQQQKGKIILKDIENFQKEGNRSNLRMKLILDRFMPPNNVRPQNVRVGATYMIAQLIYPYLVEQYENNPEETIGRLKKYLNAVKNNNYNGALECLGINFDEKTINIFISKSNARNESFKREKDIDKLF